MPPLVAPNVVTELLRRLQYVRHDADLLRVLVLIRVGADQSELSSVPARLLQIAQEVRDDYGTGQRRA